MPGRPDRRTGATPPLIGSTVKSLRKSAAVNTLGLAGWNGLQQLQLRHAYMAGREQVALETIKREAR
jgi:hypothetical protein